MYEEIIIVYKTNVNEYYSVKSHVQITKILEIVKKPVSKL